MVLPGKKFGTSECRRLEMKFGVAYIKPIITLMKIKVTLILDIFFISNHYELKIKIQSTF